MRVYQDQDADLTLLEDKRIAVIGYGNQGRAQALNLRDSGLDLLVGNREDAYAEQAREDGFVPLPISQAVAAAEIVMLLLPDEVVPELFEAEIAPHLSEGKTLIFASGYNIAFGLISPPQSVDVALVAPRMIGAGVRDLFLAERGYPSFVSVHQDHSGGAWETALALAKGIGSTRMGVVQVTFAQEAELDLFTEQCFGPALGHVLTTSVELLLDNGYPPEAVLLELYMSGELSYTFAKIAELGLIEQSRLHSSTSQYGSMTRGMRFIMPELRTKMEAGLEEIRSGQFAREWAEEQAAGSPTLDALREAARSMPLYEQERALRAALRTGTAADPPYPLGRQGTEDGSPPAIQASEASPVSEPSPGPAVATEKRGLLTGLLAGLFRARERLGGSAGASTALDTPDPAQMEDVLRDFLRRAVDDPALQAFSQGRQMTTHYVLHNPSLEFYMQFQDGLVQADIGAPPAPAEVRLEAAAGVLDGMFTGRINAMRAAMTGELAFSGDARAAMGIQQVQGDLSRLYARAREAVMAG